MSDTLILVPDPQGPSTINTSAFSGLPAATLQAYLNAAQAALQNLTIGGQPVVVSYGEGSGQKSVTYSRTNEGMLRNHIRELQILLGLRGRRRAISLRF
jgi:hypothetical protein